MQTRAVKADGDYVISGRKMSFSRPGEDYFAIVFAATPGVGDGTTCFLVDKDTRGFTVTGGEEGGRLAHADQTGAVSEVRRLQSASAEHSRGARSRPSSLARSGFRQGVWSGAPGASASARGCLKRPGRMSNRGNPMVSTCPKGRALSQRWPTSP